MATKTIAVLGGVFVDHIMITNRVPDAGESYAANSYHKALGGKGANAAIAAFRGSHKKPTGQEVPSARCANKQVNLNVRMIAAAGNDKYAAQQSEHLAGEGLDTAGLRTISDKPTALCFVMIEEGSRQNRILSFAGANHALYPEDFTTAESLGRGIEPDLVVCQLELLTSTIEQVLETAGKAGIEVVLNAAPADQISLDKYAFITHLLINETEAAILLGLDAHDLDDMRIESWVDFAKKFLAGGVKNVVITLGERGAVYASERGAEGHVGAFQIQVVDVTGAGDTFTGVYAAEYLRQKTMEEDWDIQKAVVRACKAAALTVAALGAQDGIPWADQIEDFVVDEEAPRVGEQDRKATGPVLIEEASIV